MLKKSINKFSSALTLQTESAEWITRAIDFYWQINLIVFYFIFKSMFAYCTFFCISSLSIFFIVHVSSSTTTANSHQVSSQLSDEIKTFLLSFTLNFWQIFK